MTGDLMKSSARAAVHIRKAKKEFITDLAVVCNGTELVIVGWDTTNDGLLRLHCERPA